MKNQTSVERQQWAPLTFEGLPEAVGQLYSKLETIEYLLLQKQAPSHPDKDDLLVISQACEFLHLSSPTIYALVSSRKVPFMKRSKRLYFSKKALTEWLTQSGREVIS
jgi:excisionase family DNA binding protein